VSKKVADLLVDVLAEAGIRRIYGVVGDSLNGITDSIRVKNNLEWVHVRHEETGAFAAGAEAHLTGKLAVCAGSCGPGKTHLINGFYNYQRNYIEILSTGALTLYPIR
jgi:pyruvate dehydrogenase (quinone)